MQTHLKLRTQATVDAALKYLSLIIASLVSIVPLLVIFFASFKTGEEFAATGPFDPPANWLNFANYAAAITSGNMLLGLMNTVILLVASVAGTILIGTMAAYVLSRFSFPFKRTIVFLFLLASLVPGVTTQVATFQVVSGLGLFNTRWSAILLFMGTDIISISIFLQFLGGIPVELDESAILDGASYFRIYRSVIFPLHYPAIATVIIIKGVAIYNEFYIPFLYMPKTSLGVISTALFRFKGPFIAQWEIISAGIVLAIIPSLVTFIALQKYIYNGLTQGAVKS